MTGSQVRVLFAAPVPRPIPHLRQATRSRHISLCAWTDFDCQAALLLRLVGVVFVGGAFAFFFFAGLGSDAGEACAMPSSEEPSTSRCASSQCESALPSLQP